MIVRVLLSGILGFVAGTIIFNLVIAAVLGALGNANAWDFARAFAPFGAILGTIAGITWQIVRGGKRP